MPNLDQIITIQSVTYTKSTTGQDIATWGTFEQPYAAVEIPKGHNLKAIEAYKAGKQQSATWYEVTIRRLVGVTTSMQVVWASELQGTVTMDIRAVESKRERDEYMILTCEVVV